MDNYETEFCCFASNLLHIFSIPVLFFRILFECGIIADVEKQHFVEISDCRGDGANLYLQGTKSDITAARKAMTRELKVGLLN